MGVAFAVAAVASHDFLILSILLTLFSAFMIARPLVSAVIVDQYSVTSKGMFSQHSLPRSSITSIERVHTGRGTILTLWGNVEEKEELSISENLFAFDEGWDDWLSIYKDVSSEKPLSLFDKS